jgi:ABC-type transport system involved in multi-copper enzyme maturation permease subunit
MLLSKFWLETRNRFFIGMVFITALCLFFVFGEPWILNRWRMDELADPTIYNPPWLLVARNNYTYFIWHFLYNYLLQFTWAIFTIMLALGGLHGEQEKGSALFTLSLPVGRGKLFVNRILVGFLEATVLALVPSLLIPIASHIIGLDYSFSVALRHGLLFVVGGIVYYMLGVLINTFVRGEPVSFFVAIGFVVIFYFLFQPYSEGMEMPNVLRLIDLPGFIAGNSTAESFDGLWLIGFVCSLIFSALLFTLCYRSTIKKDF